MKKYVIFAFIFSLFVIFCNNSYPQTPPPGQTGGGLQKQEQQIQTERRLEKQIKEKKKKPGEPVVEEKLAPIAGEGEKILINKIEVRDATLIPKDIVGKIIKDYEGKTLSVKDMQKVCDLITDEYRNRGRVTSRAYLPPQSIKGGLLVIVVIEGKLGSVDVKNNKFFSASQIKKKLTLKPGSFFDYKDLQKSLVKINENPDIFVKSVLVPGKEPGTTDVVVEVEDKLPVHVGYELDNFGSRYIDYFRHTVTAEDNNLFGMYDKFSFKYQKGDNQFYDLTSISYTIPLFDRLDVGTYWLWSTSKLGKEFKALDVKGYSSIGGAFFNYNIIDLGAVVFALTGGFDAKNITNYTSGVETSRDVDRVIKVGCNLDMYDKWGRTIVTLEEDAGVAGGDLHKKDLLATRPGAGAEFGKLTGNLYRLQPMPFSSTILWRNTFQATNYNMLAVESFQLGGISNVRGYSPAEYVGDEGLTSTVEWSFPPYFIPKDVKVPLSKSTFYDATRLVAFYDMGYVHVNNPTGTTKKNTAIQGWGLGLRFNLPEDCFVRLEAAYRIDRKATFESVNGYIDAGKKF